MMNNDNNEKDLVVNEQPTQNDNVESSVVNKQTETTQPVENDQQELSLLEQSKIAEAEEKSKQELDAMRTKLGAERALKRLVDEEGFEIGQNYEEAEKERIAKLENETVKEDLNRRYHEFVLSWQDPTKRKIRSKNIITFFAIVFRTFILFGLCFVILTPIIEKISYALRYPGDISNQQVVWIPENWSVLNIEIAFKYLTLIKDNSFVNIPFLYNISTFANTIILSTIATVLQVISTAIAGYSFARLKFKGNNIIFFLILLTLIVPSESLQTARMLFFYRYPFFGIKLIGNSMAIYIQSAFGMGLRSAIFVYLFRQFFRGIPIELEESAEIDGAGVIRTFWSVMLPNARGAIVTVSIFSFVWQYNDYYWATLYGYHNSNVMPLLTTALASSSETFNSIISTSFTQLVADLGEGIANNSQFYGLILNTAALLMMLPIIIAYLFAQNLFVESIERTGITGM